MGRTGSTRHLLVAMASAVVVVMALLAGAFASPARAGSSLWTPSGTAASTGFSDVQGGEWYAPAAQAAAASAVMLRHMDGTFDAGGTVTRGEMAYYLARALGQAEAPDQPFSDIHPWDWFAGSVGAMVRDGIVAGSTGAEFLPQQAITRQEAALLVMRAWAARDGALIGSDAEPPLTPKEAVRWLRGFRDRRQIDPACAASLADAWRLGILDSPTDNLLAPDAPLTRAEMVAMLYRTFLGPVSTEAVDEQDLLSGDVRDLLEVGARGTAVRLLESRLDALRYACGPADGIYDHRTRDGVMAFQKVEGLERTGRVTAEVWKRLATATTPKPRLSGKKTRCEVDLSRQVLLMITDDRVTEVVHISSGRGGTPPGHHRIEERLQGWIACVTVNDYMYSPAYVFDLIAVHGYPNVPDHPASHGCVRTPIWIADDIYAQLRTGTVIDMYR